MDNWLNLSIINVLGTSDLCPFQRVLVCISLKMRNCLITLSLELARGTSCQKIIYVVYCLIRYSPAFVLSHKAIKKIDIFASAVLKVKNRS